MNKQPLRIFALCAAAAAVMTLCACGSNKPKVPNVDPADGGDGVTATTLGDVAPYIVTGENGEDPIWPPQETGTQSMPTEEPRPTVPMPEGTMSIHDVLVLSDLGTDLKWSNIEAYVHTDSDGNTAVFDVRDEYGRQCTLTVVHDGDTIQSAVLSKDDISIDIRTESVMSFWSAAMQG